MISIRPDSIYHRVVAITLLLFILLIGVLLLELIISVRAEAKSTLEQKQFEDDKLSNIVAEKDIHAEINKQLRGAIQTSQSMIHLNGLNPESYAEETVHKLTHGLNRKGVALKESKTSLVDIGYGVKQLSIQLEAEMPHRSLQGAVIALESMQKEGMVSDLHLSRLSGIAEEQGALKMLLEYRLYLDTLN